VQGSGALRPGGTLQLGATTASASGEALTGRAIAWASTDLTVAMDGAATAGVWGWTDRPGTVAHWPGGVVKAGGHSA
jgi:hypothetical protein